MRVRLCGEIKCVKDLLSTTNVKLFCEIKMLSSILRLLHKGESLCCFRDSALVTYGGMLPSDLTLSALRFILSAKSRQSYEQDCETVDFCNSLILSFSKRSRGEVPKIGN